ncbi:aldehyde dehydrogenase family protein, partial [Ferroacidibacillus organovorans]
MQLGEYKNYIAGVFTDGEATETFDVLNPATEEVLATVSNATPGDVVRAVTAATDAQPIFAD